MAYSRNNPRPVRNLHQHSVQESYKKLEQEKLLQEHQILEEIRRQNEFMRKQGMMFEKAIAVASSSAAGAGGGSGNRRTKAVDAAGQSMLYSNFTNGVFSYFIYNFETEILTSVKTIQMQNGPSVSPITRGGFFLQSYNSHNINYDLFFLNLNGDVIWQDTTENSSDVDIENFSRYVAAYYLKGDSWKLVAFDENSNIKSFDFENRIEGGGYSYDDVWNGGFVVREEIGSIYKFHIINMLNGSSTFFKQNDFNESNVNVFQYAYSDRIVTVENYRLIEVFNSIGQKITDFDSHTEFETEDWSFYQFSFLENNSFIIFGSDNDNNQYTVTFYSGTSDSFSYKTIGSNNYYDYDIYEQKSYKYPRDWVAEGSAIFLFYTNGQEPNNIRYYDDAKILPIWSTDSQLRDFYDFSVNRGINENLDDTNVAITKTADYINLLIDNDRINDVNYSILRFNREGDVTTVIPTNIPKSLSLYDDDIVTGKTVLQFETTVRSMGSWGWSDLSDVEDRLYYSLRESANGDFTNLADYPIDIVMKDIVSDQYWTIRFTEWQQDGGGFAYTRQLIQGGTFSGSPIAFTFSDWEFGEPDIIVPGVLELRRNQYGPIYNSAIEDDSNNNNPAGTVWNSEYVYNLNSSYEYKWYYTDGSASNPTNSTDFNALFDGVEEGSGITNNTEIDWTDVSNKPGYLPAENFAWQVDCLLKVDIAGTYSFNTLSDDGNQLSINGNIVTEFYGGRGIESASDTSEPIYLSVGLYTFRYRLEQGGGSSGVKVQWQRPVDGTFSVIPSSNLVINQGIREYLHYIVATDGQIIGSVSTGDQYYNDYEGKTHVLEDEIFGKTWVSNNQNNRQWQLLSEYYSDSEDNNNISTETGLRTGNYILSSLFKSRIVTEDSISDVINIPTNGESLNKVADRDIFHNGAWVLTYDENNANFYFYNISGQLIGQKTIQGIDFGGYNQYNYGKRCSIIYSKNFLSNVIVFDGVSIKEIETGFENIDLYVNDYNWWND